MSDRSVLHSLAVTLADADAVPDAELLRRYAESADAVAFELLVRRHAELVWAVCRSAHPTDHQTAEDAFQATFLALARKAGLVRDPSAAGWLFRVARNAAVRAKRRPGSPLPNEMAVVPPDRAESAEVARIVTEEVDRLAAKFREPVLLCFYEGFSHAQAAERLGWAVGTVASRLARAKDRLRDRLTRRGVALPAVGFGVLVGGSAPAAAIKAAVHGNTTDAVRTLSTEVLRAMTIRKLTLVACVTAVLVLAGSGAALAWKPEQRRNSPTPKAKPAKEDDQIALQGKWKVIKMAMDGVEAPADELKEMEWEIQDDKIRFVDKPGDERMEMSFTIAPDQSPKHIDLTMALTGPNVPAAERNKTMAGIYELKDGKLTFCLGKDEKGRPTEFKADKATKTTLMVLQKVEPKKDEKPKAGKAKPADDELKKFGGKWRVVRIANPRGEAPEDELKGMNWEITGNKIVGRDTADEKGKEGLFLIDPKKEPKQIDLTMPGGNGPQVLPGVYEFKDGRLRISVAEPGGDRPTTFEVNPKTGGLIELEKNEPKKDDKPKADPEKGKKEREAFAAEQQQFQGEWKVVKAEVNGTAIAPQDEALKEMGFVIRGSEVRLSRYQHKDEEKDKDMMLMAFDATASPKQINLTAVIAPQMLKGKFTAGIYEFKDGKLTLCLAGLPELSDKNRPAEFKSVKGKDVALVVLEKVEKKK